MSVLPPKADIADAMRNVRFVPKADIAQRYSILLSTVMLRRAAGFAQNVGDREVRCVTTSETGRPFAVAVLRPPAAPDSHGTRMTGLSL
jgi:hypothetical protein